MIRICPSSVVRRPSSDRAGPGLLPGGRLRTPCLRPLGSALRLRTTDNGQRTTDQGQRSGFTLIELLVVILIIGLVSAVALPTVLPALNHRQVSEAGRILQGALVGARDKAIHDNQPCGIRLLPDPAFPIQWTSAGVINPYGILAYNRIIPLESAPEYSEGYCTPVPHQALAGTSPYTYNINPQVTFSWPNLAFPPYPNALYLVESPADPKSGAPNAPTSWFWNVRVGDKIQLNGAGPWYTVIGPATQYSNSGNTELFVNAGPPGPIGNQKVPQINGQPVEYLILVNGQDDNNNGWIDEGFDGVDNNAINGVDDLAEWETEVWLGSVVAKTPVNIPYTIQRRPAPSTNAREVALPTAMVIDATCSLAALPGTTPQGNPLFPTQERSRLPVDVMRYSGYVDIVLNPDGTVLPTTMYSSPSSFNMGSAFYHFWLAERQDLAAVQTDNNGNPLPLATGTPYYLPIAEPGGTSTGTFSGPYLKGEYSVLTLYARTGQIAVNASPPFLNSSGVYNATNPFIQAEQGVSGGP